MKEMQVRLAQVRAQISQAGAGRDVDLVAVSKLQPASAIRSLAALGQRRFGENYVQEALAKQSELHDLDLEWHLIGPLQSNKCREVARCFDWVHTIDRAKLVPLLARERLPELAPLNVLIQVNISDETSKSGCSPAQVAALADLIVAEPRLCLRGLMAIPAPWPEWARRRQDFASMQVLFREFRARHAQADTLSMGMSDDFALAIGEGATMVRIGSALFGARAVQPNRH
jgi:pyridoxal phosphate enzyme (YggS family)